MKKLLLTTLLIFTATIPTVADSGFIRTRSGVWFIQINRFTGDVYAIDPFGEVREGILFPSGVLWNNDCDARHSRFDPYWSD